MVTARLALTGNLPTDAAADWIKNVPVSAPVLTFFNVSSSERIWPEPKPSEGREYAQLSQCLDTLVDLHIITVAEVTTLYERVYTHWIEDGSPAESTDETEDGEHGLVRLCRKTGLSGPTACACGPGRSHPQALLVKIVGWGAGTGRFILLGCEKRTWYCKQVDRGSTSIMCVMK